MSYLLGLKNACQKVEFLLNMTVPYEYFASVVAVRDSHWRLGEVLGSTRTG